jgi:predicted  nucleic acid-binding Zn-ribbon protein
MDDLKNKSIKIENYEATLTSGDLINIIQHSVTRDDMESLRKEFKDDFVNLDNKIDNVRAELKSDINKLDSKIDNVAEKLDSKIEALKSELNNKMDSNFKWTLGVIIVGILVPIALHFIK